MSGVLNAPSDRDWSPHCLLRWQALATIGVYVLLSVLLMVNHEPWRDEAQAWFIARDSLDLASLFREMGYEGSPALWHILLRPLARMGLPITAMAVLSLLVAFSSVLLILRYAPFSDIEKALLVFGYYLLYEYSILARSYCLSVFFLFLTALVYGRRFKKPAVYGLSIFFLANTTLYGFVIAFILFCFYWLEFFFVEKRGVNPIPWSFLLIASAGFAAVVWQVWPPADLAPPSIHAGQPPSLIRRIFTWKTLDKIPNSLISAFLPVPEPQIHFWNTKTAFLMPYYRPRIVYLSRLEITIALMTVIRPALTFAPVLISLLPFLRKRFLLFLYLALSFGLIAFFLLVYEAGIRHQGFIFMVFVFCLWIGEHYRAPSRNAEASRWEFWSTALRRGAVPLLFFFPFVASVFACYFDLKYDFSTGKRTGEFLIRNNLIDGNTLVASYPSNYACSVLPYIGASRKLYFLENRDMRGHMTWNTEYLANRKLSVEEVMKRIEEGAVQRGCSSVLFISNFAVRGAEFRERYEEVFAPPIAVKRDEMFHVYRKIRMQEGWDTKERGNDSPAPRK